MDLLILIPQTTQFVKFFVSWATNSAVTRPLLPKYLLKGRVCGKIIH